MSHPQFIHENGDVCIWDGGGWFVPVDAGGEGYDCEHGHPTDDALEAARREGAADELDDAAEDYPDDDGLLGGPPHWLRTRAAALRGDA